MIILEVDDNPNCSAMSLRVFHELEPPRPISHVRLEREPGAARWYQVTGWTMGAAPCPARLQKVDDSGEGVAFLVYGGDAGLRLQAADAAAPWSLESADQWGEPFLLLGDPGESSWHPGHPVKGEVTHHG
jgi:hypothetical protein